MNYSQEYVEFLHMLGSKTGSGTVVEAIYKGFLLSHPQLEGRLTNWAKKGLATAAIAGSMSGCMDLGTQPDYQTQQHTYPTYSSTSYDGCGQIVSPASNCKTTTGYQTPSYSSSSVYTPQTTNPTTATPVVNVDPTCNTTQMKFACDDYDQIKKSSGNSTTAMNVVSDADGVNRKLINQCCDPTNNTLYTNWCNNKRASCADSTRHYYVMNGMGRSDAANRAVAKCNDLCEL